MKAVIIVPRRDDHGHRDRVWAWVRAWWERELRLPVFEGHHDGGLFNRAAACNRAAAAAGKWDVAVLIDSDVICDPDQVREAIRIAHATQDHLVLPFTLRHNLKQGGSEAIMAGDTGSWRSHVGITYHDQCSAVVVIPRPLWDQVGGFDEQFVGWGFEDNAFACAAETFGGRPIEKLAGEVWHLWHPTAKEGRRTSPSYRANRARHDLYRAALGDRDAIRALLDGGSDPIVELRERESIPRILHRVVPEQTSDQVEAWWTAFERLHPGWQLMTHRDPLDPAEWPMTAKAWPACTSGAQLAGLVRLEALYRWGGIYVDSDVEPHRSLEPLLSLRAFAAWEDDKVVPDAVLGAEPEHPAIKACIDQALRRVRAGAWASGPGVTTQVLRRRSDVLLLPPGTFYPVHYRDPERASKMAKPDWEPWTFALHHYAGSWLPENQHPAGGEQAAARAQPAMTRQPESLPKVSFLVPFRDADGSRTAAKDWVLARWRAAFPQAEFIVAPDDGQDPFNKSMAVNSAARQASGDVFVILDADTWIEPEWIRQGVELASQGRWVIPARRSYRLTREFSDQLLALTPADELPQVVFRRTVVEQAGPVVGFCHIVPRSAFEAVGGMDERFRGWGGEDSSFARALDVVHGRHVKLRGMVISLWHDRPRDRGRIWQGQTDDHRRRRRELGRQYTRIGSRRESMLAFLAEPGGPLSAEVAA